MNQAEQQVEEAKAARRSARDSLALCIARVRGDVEERGVGGRIADKLGEDARATLDEAKAVVRAYPGIVAGTIAAIAVWIFRNPLLSLLGRLSRQVQDRLRR